MYFRIVPLKCRKMESLSFYFYPNCSKAASEFFHVPVFIVLLIALNRQKVYLGKEKEA